MLHCGEGTAGILGCCGYPDPPHNGQKQHPVLYFSGHAPKLMCACNLCSAACLQRIPSARARNISPSRRCKRSDADHHHRLAGLRVIDWPRADAAASRVHAPLVQARARSARTETWPQSRWHQVLCQGHRLITISTRICSSNLSITTCALGSANTQTLMQHCARERGQPDRRLVSGTGGGSRGVWVAAGTLPARQP
jgi:hypothetical protein